MSMLALRRGATAVRWCQRRAAPAVRCMAAQEASRTRKVKVAHIQFAADEAGRASLQAVRQQLGAGGDFALLAQEHSTCASKGRGGLLGWLYRGTFLPAFEEAALGAPVGSVVEAETGRGLHLIQVRAGRRALGLAGGRRAAQAAHLARRPTGRAQRAGRG
jgi:hypothetical protein